MYLSAKWIVYPRKLINTVLCRQDPNFQIISKSKRLREHFGQTPLDCRGDPVEETPLRPRTPGRTQWGKPSVGVRGLGRRERHRFLSPRLPGLCQPPHD